MTGSGVRLPFSAPVLSHSAPIARLLQLLAFSFWPMLEDPFSIHGAFGRTSFLTWAPPTTRVSLKPHSVLFVWRALKFSVHYTGVPTAYRLLEFLVVYRGCGPLEHFKFLCIRPAIKPFHFSSRILTQIGVERIGKKSNRYRSYPETCPHSREGGNLPRQYTPEKRFGS